MLKRLTTSLTVAMLVLGAGAATAANGAYKLTRTFPIGGTGGWDYATLNASGTRLYLPRTTHTQVIDTATGKVVGDVPGNDHSHGVALVPAANRGFVTSSEHGGFVQIFDLKTNKLLGRVTAADDADGAIYDPASNRVLVMCGDAKLLIPIDPRVDPQHGKAEPAVQLGGEPEFAAVDGQGKAFVNLVKDDQVAVVDTRHMKVVAHWPTGPGSHPVGMAIDPAKHLLFIGCHNQTMVVMRSTDGHVLARLPIGRGVDATAVFHGDGYASCGDGTLTIVHETSPGHFAVAEKVQTARGARTMAVDQNDGTVYLPTAELKDAKPRPKPVPGTFKVLEFSRR